MYNSPFGSIFKPESNRLGFLSNQPKKEPATEEEITPKPIAESKPEAAPSATEEIGKKIEEVQESKVISPSTIKALKNKKPFDVLPPQFRAATTMRSDDPQVKAEQSKILVEKNKQKLSALKSQIEDIKTKITSAKIYRDVLSQYTQLAKQDKEALDGWVATHIVAIKKLNAARKLKTLAKTNKEAAKALTAEIKHWENLRKLKEEGADIQGKTVLKTFRPTESSVSSSPKDENPIPILKSAPSTDEIVRLKKKISKGSELRGLEATDEAIKSLAKETPKKTYKELFVDQLPGRGFILEQRTANKALSRLVKKTEKTMVRAHEYEWRSERAQEKLQELTSQYRDVQENLSDLIKTFASDPQSTQTLTALGILLEARPERFLSAPTLLQASMNAFTRLSNLGDVNDIPPTPEAEADALLKEASTESTTSLHELETKQSALDQLKAEVEDKPPPPPIYISVEVKPPKPPKPTAVSFINKALPWIAGLYILKRLMEG